MGPKRQNPVFSRNPFRTQIFGFPGTTRGTCWQNSSENPGFGRNLGKWAQNGKIRFSLQTHSGPKLSDFRGQTDGPDGRIYWKIWNSVEIIKFPKTWIFTFFSATKVMKNDSKTAKSSFQSKPIQNPKFRISGNNPIGLTA